ncbi:hypothetical protein [Micromonospora mirobrigensis]|uniref:Lipoprotein n=1 Tax=Micromonospora mirobrigensis TaxID=262898 RepID=A0A1C4V4B9_9ACTN|nr:hypothetical protein [Micromonospora mirobrigensis]SCE78832.1 hypothetical protein GA0070564_101944 [Micromonospora mirobrigensis]
MTRTTATTAALALAAVAALTAGCQGDDDPAGTPQAAPTSPAATATTPAATTEPTPSASPSPLTAANTASVCRAVDELILKGSREIAADSAAATRQELTPEQVEAQLRENLADLADDVRRQAARADDPQIRALVADAAKKIDAGAGSSAPVKWLNSTFVAIPPRLARDCRA